MNINSLLKKCIPTPLLPLAKEIHHLFYKDSTGQKLASEVNDLQYQWKRIIDNSESEINALLKSQKNQHILFFSGYGIGTHFLTSEPIIMMSLFARGCRISSIFCNASLPACEFNYLGNNKPRVSKNLQRGMLQKTILSTCQRCRSNISSTYKCFPVNMFGYDDFINDSIFQQACELADTVEFENFRWFEHEGVKIGEEVFASILRSTFMGTVDENPLNRQLVRRFLIAGIMLAKAAEKAFTSLKPDKIVLIHGVYLTHGIPVKVAEKLGIPVIVVGGGGIRKDTTILCHGETYHKQLVNESNSLWENDELTEKQKEIILTYTRQKRTAGAGVDYLNYHPNPIEDIDILYDELKLDPQKPIISAFTNVIWDAQIFYSCNAFTDIFEWVFTSIREMGRNDKINFVIRIHPAEVKGGSPTKQPMLKEIQKRFPHLPDNVRIIPPESDISSYTLVEISKVCIIYGTKMGLEIALMKKPLIICGETFSRNKGYGLDITSKEQYIDLVKEIHNYKTDNSVAFERALKYANYFYFRKMLKLPFTTNVNGVAGSGKNIDLADINDLTIGKSEEIDTICNGILNMSLFHLK